MTQPDPDSKFRSDFRIVVVGAGLVGLGLAILLRRSGFDVMIIEQDEALREVILQHIL